MSARVRVKRVADSVYVGSLTLGCPDAGGVGDSEGDGVITIGAFGDTKADALHKATVIAERIASDPVLQAILPPGTMAAIQATKKLSTAAKRGSRALRGLWRKIRGPGKKRLAKALHKEAAQLEGYSDAEVAGLWSGVKKVARGVAKGAKVTAKYGTPAGLTYMAAKKISRKLRKRPAARRAAPSNVQPPPSAEPMPQQYEAPMPEEQYSEEPAAEQYEPMPEEQYAEEQYADDYADNGEGEP
jgi:hypothetical protein